MKFRTRCCLSVLLIASTCAFIPAERLFAQQDKVAALKQSLGENKEKLRQYKWVETTAVSLKGEEKARTQKLCFYGPDGKVQKQEISAPAPQQSPGGVKGKVVAKKKGEMTEYMKQAVGLVHQYLPPDPQRIQAVKAAGGLSVSPTGPGAVRIDLRNYLKNGDSLGLNLDTASNLIQTINVNSYLESEKDAITMSITFARLGDGVSYPATILLNAPEKKLQVKIQNSNYEPVAPQAAAPQSPPTRAPVSPQAAAAVDQLTAPIALYPDALIAQILSAAGDVGALQSFAKWLAGNTNLKGSELQDAAQKAGFDAPYIALAPFPQVIQMMAQKPDWTTQLGQAFTADKNAVFDSIQRLRAKAQATGNLKSTPQQTVETEATSSGQQVIVIQPANPQVVYVPTYNPQTVYVAAPPAAAPSAAGVAAVAFTAGVIIGASSNHYYHGPYAWHGAAMYNEAWEHREDYVENRNEMYQENAEQRQSAAKENQGQRQSEAQERQGQRQDAAGSGQPQSAGSQSRGQSGASTSQASRQPSASTSQASRQPSASTSQASRQPSASSMQSQAGAGQAQRQSAAATSSYGGGQSASQRSGTSSGGFSGYQSGSATRAQSERGSGSVSSSRSGGGRRR